MIDVAGNVAELRERIARAAERAGRDPAEVVLVAAAKTKSAALVRAAIEAGVTDIGENYVQEAVAKQPAVGLPARWHMIGHLQRNKAPRAAELFAVIQTVDSLALAEALARQGASTGQRVRILIEVNLGAEATKSGLAAERVPDLIERLGETAQLCVEGLMTIPPPLPPAEVRPFFRRLRQMRDRLQLAELSMGMSEDFEVAIEEGATMVRVGRAIFGEREPRAARD